MAGIYKTTTWLEDIELKILKEYDFEYGVLEEDIPEEKRTKLPTLMMKGFLFTTNGSNGLLYVGTCAYVQHFK